LDAVGIDHRKSAQTEAVSAQVEVQIACSVELNQKLLTLQDITKLAEAIIDWISATSEQLIFAGFRGGCLLSQSESFRELLCPRS